MNAGEVRQYWDRKAQELGMDPTATMKDVILRSLEIEAIGQRLRIDDVLLDVGAGNAFAAVQWADKCREITAIDYSASMIESAHDAITRSGCKNIRVEVGNVLNLADYADRFSAVSCVRCLINLTSESDQYTALDQLVSVLRPGGRLFLLEGIEENFLAMNAQRVKLSLPPIKLHWHNRLFARDKLAAKLSERLSLQERIDFGEYYFLSRLVHPLSVAPAEPQFDGPLNFIAKEIWRSGIARGQFAFMSPLVLYVCVRDRF